MILSIALALLAILALVVIAWFAYKRITRSAGATHTTTAHPQQACEAISKQPECANMADACTWNPILKTCKKITKPTGLGQKGMKLERSSNPRF